MAEHSNLREALLAVQKDSPALPKDGRNPHFNSTFTKLDTIRETIGPLLIEHGLTWSTFPCFGPNGEPALRYKLTHVASGDCESEVMPILVTKSDPQGLGSATTYARRYSITAVLDLVADEDDDGNSASRPAAATAARPEPVAQPAQQTERVASAKQRGLMNAKAAEAQLAPSEFADAILRATEQDAREFDSQDAAKNWVQRALDRLPARHVDNVLAEIVKATSGAVAA
jgi:hypothetical protein